MSLVPITGQAYDRRTSLQGDQMNTSHASTSAPAISLKASIGYAPHEWANRREVSGATRATETQPKPRYSLWWRLRRWFGRADD